MTGLLGALSVPAIAKINRVDEHVTHHEITEPEIPYYSGYDLGKDSGGSVVIVRYTKPGIGEPIEWFPTLTEAEDYMTGDYTK